MTTERKIIYTLAAIIILIAGVVAFGWLKEHDAKIATESKVAEQQNTINGLKQQIAAIPDKLNAQIADLEAMRKMPATPQQAVNTAAKLIPNLPKPLTIISTSQPDINGKLQDEPVQQVAIPSEDIPALQDFAISCKEGSAKLDACQQTLQLTRAQLKLTEMQRDERTAEANGGSKWQKAGKLLGCAAMTGIGGAAGAITKKPVWGAVGAITGFVGCQFVF